jgi:DNA mismatch repair protein MutH
MLSIAELTTKILDHTAREIACARTENKGSAGLLLETITGVKHGPAALDCTDGELKVYPIEERQDRFLPKETMAICMLSKEDLRDNEFETSRVAKKMATMLIVPYIRTDDTVTYKDPYTFRLSDHPELTAVLKADYDAIRAKFLEDGTLTSSTGTILQNRTKGAGHGSTSRAFYLRKEFMLRVMPIHQ